MNISTIIFDLGNVITTHDRPYHTVDELKEFTDYFNIKSLDNLDSAWDSAFPLYRLGEINEKEFWRKYLTIARAKNLDVDYCIKFWRKYQKEIDHMFSFLERFKVKYQLALLTTVGKEWLEYRVEKFGLDKYFAKIVSSAQYHIAKPNPEIYKIILEELNHEPESVLFIDDTQTNLPPAEKLGMKTLLFQGQENLEREFSKLNL